MAAALGAVLDLSHRSAERGKEYLAYSLPSHPETVSSMRTCPSAPCVAARFDGWRCPLKFPVPLKKSD